MLRRCIMDWSDKGSWEMEDQEYRAKRKANNKNSFYHRHMFGVYQGYKMQRGMRYESNNEKLFFFLLDLAPEVIRFYEQPVEIPVRFLSERGVIKESIHVPDVLVFRENHVPWLIQIKEPDPKLLEDISFLKLQEICKDFARSKGWEYSVLYPKNIPIHLQKNIKFLVNFLHLDNIPVDLVNRIQSFLHYRRSTSILELSEFYQPDYQPYQAKPVIFHMIAKSILSTDLSVPITSMSVVTINNAGATGISKYLEKGSCSDVFL